MMTGKSPKRGRPPAKKTTVKIRFKQSVFEMWRNKKQASGYGHYSIFAEYLLHCGPGNTISAITALWLAVFLTHRQFRIILLIATLPQYISGKNKTSPFLGSAELPTTLPSSRRKVHAQNSANKNAKFL